MNVLVIDDDKSLRRALERVLTEAGYQATGAENGVVGLRLYRAQPTDIVITDLLMPEKEGIETIMELQAMRPRPKVIAMSGLGHEYLPMARRLGADRVLEKPFKPEEILVAIQSLVEAVGGRR